MTGAPGSVLVVGSGLIGASIGLGLRRPGRHTPRRRQ